ncbi:MAG: hypothetical protein GY932_02025 [Arcobacter sp.]|nr:hypothetical protein [Arcobacter sp.]
MKIAIPVKDENLIFFPNAGHTPKFAIYSMSGLGKFKSFKLEDIITNPRTDIDQSKDEEKHNCNHSHNDMEHIEQHNKMGRALTNCNYIVLKSACKNTAKSFISQGIKLIKYNGDSFKTDSILKEISNKFS